MAKDAASEVDSVVQAALEGVATFARTLHARSRCWQLLMAWLVVATWLGQLLLLILKAASDATRRAI